MLIGDDAGFSDNAFVTTVGDLAQGVIDRSSFGIGQAGQRAFLVNAMYHKMTGRDMDDTSARGMQGFLALIEAINRAGSTEPAKIQAALQSQDLKPDQLMIGYKGIKYNAQGQNTLASTLLVQLDGKKYVAVWPEKSAACRSWCCRSRVGADPGRRGKQWITMPGHALIAYGSAEADHARFRPVDVRTEPR